MPRATPAPRPWPSRWTSRRSRRWAIPWCIEATSAAGASATVTGTGTDPDPGDTLTYRWSEEGVVFATTPSVTRLFSPGIHALVFRVTDALGAWSDAILQVEITDTTAPTLTLPANPVREATGPAGAAVTFTVAAADTVDAAPVARCDRASGSAFPLAVTTVTCQATDYSGNTATGAFTVTVRDTTAPSISVPAPIVREATSAAGAVVPYTVTATDLVSGAVAAACAPASGATFPRGTTTVTCTATDAASNTGTRTFAVTVRDTIKPVLTLPAPIVQPSSGPSTVVTFTATAADAIDGARPVECTPGSGSGFPVGLTTVTC